MSRSQCIKTCLQLAWLAATCAIAGCAWPSPAAPGRLDRAAAPILPADAWPIRHVEPLLEIARRPAAEQRDDRDNDIKHLRESIVGREGAMIEHLAHEGHFGQGVITRFIPDAADMGKLAETFYFVSVSDRYIDQTNDGGGPADMGAILLPDDRLALTLTDLTLTLPEGRPRGLVVHLTSIMRHSPYEAPMRRELRQRGWAVLECGHPSSFYERSVLLMSSHADLSVMAQWAARSIDDRVADWAYAVEGMLDYLTERRPELMAGPTVLTGYSLGALVLPAVAARAPERFEAAVIVAGGANLLHVMEHARNSLPHRQIGLEIWFSSVEEAPAQEDLEAAYLEISSLDPAHTASQLRNKPVLVLHGLFDDVVPASAGRQLQAALERPEVWTYPVGHFALFWLLPRQVNAIANWIDRATRTHARPGEASVD